VFTHATFCESHSVVGVDGAGGVNVVVDVVITAARARPVRPRRRPVRPRARREEVKASNDDRPPPAPRVVDRRRASIDVASIGVHRRR
jgi:hypothetical protein